MSRAGSFHSMIRSRSSSLVAAVAVSAVVLYGLAGHGLLHIESQDGIAGAAAGLCLVLVTMLGCIAVPRPEVLWKAVVTVGPRAHGGPPEPPRADGRARASPVTLQRFRN